MLSSHVIANYSDALRTLTGTNTGTWSEQHRDLYLSQRSQDYQHLMTFITFLQEHNPFRKPKNDLINISTCVIASNAVNADTAVEIGRGILSEINGKCLGDIKLKRKNHAKTFAVMRKAISVENVCVQVSSAELFQRLLAYIQSGHPTSDVFSYELSAVAPSLFHDNGQMKTNNKAELITELIKFGEMETWMFLRIMFLMDVHGCITSSGQKLVTSMMCAAAFCKVYLMKVKMVQE